MPVQVPCRTCQRSLTWPHDDPPTTPVQCANCAWVVQALSKPIRPDGQQELKV